MKKRFLTITRYGKWVQVKASHSKNWSITDGLTPEEALRVAAELTEIAEQIQSEEPVYHKDGCTGLTVDQYGNTKG